jgi:hypothetical protein
MNAPIIGAGGLRGSRQLLSNWTGGPENDPVSPSRRR